MPTRRVDVQRFFMNNREKIQQIVDGWKPDHFGNYYDYDYIMQACVGGNCKWYHHETHMRKLSEGFPETKFILCGIGEEGDRWVEIAQKGIVERFYLKDDQWLPECEDDGEIMDLIQLEK